MVKLFLGVIGCGLAIIGAASFLDEISPSERSEMLTKRWIERHK
jgi:hypothetical protein